MSKQGNPVWTMISTSPMLGNDKKYKGALAMVSDITEKKQADKLLRESAQKYRLQAIRLQLQNKDLRQFAYIVSHNLRAPIAKIQGLAFLINQDADSKAMVPQLLQTIASEVEQLDTVVKDMNGILSVRDSGNKKMELVLFDTNLKLIEHVFENQIIESNAVITADFHEAEGLITVKSYLYSIMYNLLSNAIKYRSPERQLLIQLKTTRENDMILFCVKDNGRGINMEKNGDKIFGLYKRFHGNQVPGRGIGLNLVKAHAESLGGRVEVTSIEHTGTEFIIYLPINHYNENN
jgi:signal transduction histidine kinase